MLQNIFTWLLLAAITAGFAWLAVRSWRAKRPVLKWLGVLGFGLLAVVLALVSVLGLVGLVKFALPQRVEVPELVVQGTPEQVARGKYLANSFCTTCHSADSQLPLSGGVDIGKDLGMPLGQFVSVNLTPAGPLQSWTDGEIFRALRNGIDKNNRKLIIMSNALVRHMSDEDILAVIAFLRSQPPVEKETLDPPDQPNFLAAILYGAGMLPEGLPPIAGAITAPPKGATVEYGEYLLSYQDCRVCHGQELKGADPDQLGPKGPTLDAVKGWTVEQFISTLRTGVTPGGDPLDEQMPWQSISRLDDSDLTAMYLYISSQP